MRMASLGKLNWPFPSFCLLNAASMRQKQMAPVLLGPLLGASDPPGNRISFEIKSKTHQLEERNDLLQPHR